MKDFEKSKIIIWILMWIMAYIWGPGQIVEGLKFERSRLGHKQKNRKDKGIEWS